MLKKNRTQGKAQPPGKADWRDAFRKKQVGVNDLTLLSKVDNQSILDNLKRRFEADEIYTYIGYVLISVNPFRDLGIYTPEILQAYVGKNPIEVPPHVFAIAENAYFKMTSYKDNQCVIISGESGAGKTEAAKKIMQYISEVSAGSGSSSIQEVKDMVLATNPLLESLGCAKTLRNNNSSRHGKYLEILFGDVGEPVGARITNYLLEKNRVVGQIRDERNFHIFYQICKGASDTYRTAFGLTGPEGFHYTSQAGCLEVEGIDDVQEYADTLEAMRVIGLSAAEQEDIHRILSAILWLGNTVFREGDADARADGDGCVIADPAVPAFAASLLSVEPALLEKAITSRTIETARGGKRGSIYDVPLNPTQAAATRDALGKALYERLFEWIISRINRAMQERSPVAHIISVLDIYGFEIFDHNSFEQLCINYVNEKLQQIFIELTLKTEQEEYVREEIAWSPIKFFNNKIVCDLIEERRPPGIFAAMNDACATAHADPSAADSALTQRLTGCASNPHFEARGKAFLVRHYAGDVLYEVAGMTDKNKDQLGKDLLDLLSTSTSPFLRDDLFPERVDRDSKKRPPTASDRIKTSAGELVAKLMQSQPLYIRCIKPNSEKAPGFIDDAMVMHQIKYLGLHENVRIRRAGFASRQTFERFLQRFYLLSPRTSYAGDYIWSGSVKEGVVCILKDSGIAAEEWQLGKTKAFIRHPETLWALEHLRERYWHNMAQRIQRAWRAYLAYREESARRIQGAWRKNKDQIGWLQLREYGHQVLAGRKERRRASLVSMRRYRGDYLGVTAGLDGGVEGEGTALRALCGIAGAPGEVAFSGHVQVLVARPLRSSKPAARTLVLTGTTVYIISTVVEKRLAVQRVERQVALSALRSISLSSLQDDWIILHLTSTQVETDLAILSPHKTEFLTHILQRTGGKLPVQVAPELEYVGKPGAKGKTIRFVKDETVTRASSYKSHVVSVATGMPATSVSNPPCPKREPPPRPITTGKLIRKGGPEGRTPRPRPKVQQLPQDKTDLARLRPGVGGGGGGGGGGGAGKFPSAPVKIALAAPPPVPQSPSQGESTGASPTPPPVIRPKPTPPPAVESPPPASAPVAPGRTSSVVRPLPPPPPPPGAHPAAPTMRKVKKWKAVYDFTSEQEGEIAFEEGAFLEILERDDNGWWLAKTRGGQEGWVPSNYLEEVEVEEAIPKKKTPPPPPSRRPMPETPRSTTKSPSPVGYHSPSGENEEETPPPVRVMALPGMGPPGSSGDGAGEGGVPQWKLDLAARNAKKVGGGSGSGSNTVTRSASETPSDDGGSKGGSAGGNRNVAKLAAAFMQGGVMGMPPPGARPGYPHRQEGEDKTEDEDEDEWN